MKNLSKMTWFLAAIALFLAGNLVFTACTKDLPENNIMVPNLAGVIFKDGRLQFDSKQDFDEGLKQMMKFQRHLQKFEQQFPGFISSRTAYKNIIRKYGDKLSIDAFPDLVYAEREDGEIYIVPAIDFMFLSYIANEKGIFQIGKTSIRSKN